MKRWIVLVGLFALARPVFAQTMPMPTTPQADRMTIGPEFVQRSLDAPSTLVTASGQTFELPATGPDYDYIETQSGGTLRFSRTHDTTLRLTTNINMPGGLIDMGTTADPIPCNVHVTVVFRDVPINTSDPTKFAYDPYQWGNGWLNFGRQTRVGCTTTHELKAIASLPAGTTSVTLQSAPANWVIGGEIIIPDMATPTITDPTLPDLYQPRKESTLTITSIDGATIGLSHPLEFDHNVIVDKDQQTIVTVPVIYLERNIVFKSENPNGTRGHSVDIGHAASWDLEYNRFEGLGRTKNLTIDNTTADATGAILHIGTNEIARYGGQHHHHVDSCPQAGQCVDIGNVAIGPFTDIGAKWGFVYHVVSDVYSKNNVAVGFTGAGLITEDGPEVRNVFDHNVSAYIGHPSAATLVDGELLTSDHQVTQNNCPGCDGGGVWARGIQNTWIGQETYSSQHGFILFNIRQLNEKYPSTPGGVGDTALDPYHNTPVSVTGTVLAGNYIGMEGWGINLFPNTDLVGANNLRAYSLFISEHVSGQLVHPKLICEPGVGQSGIDASMGYVTRLEVDGGTDGQIMGCQVGLTGGGGALGTFLSNLTMSNVVNMDMMAEPTVITNVLFQPFGNAPHQHLLFGNGSVWPGNAPAPDNGISPWRTGASPFKVINWQGTGKNYLLYYAQSRADLPAWQNDGTPTNVSGPMVGGLTMQQVWDQDGFGYKGEPIKPEDVIQLDGVINGLAKLDDGSGPHYGPPRALVTWPTEGVAPSAAGTQFRAWYAMTGDPTANQQMGIQIDNDPPGVTDLGGTPFTGYLTDHDQPRPHTIRVWRVDASGAEIPNSGMTVTYCIPGGSCTPIPAGSGNLTTQAPPPPPPPPLCTDPMATNQGQPLPCVFPPPPVDVCSNIDGIQTQPPTGMQSVNGQCVVIQKTTCDLTIKVQEGSIIVAPADVTKCAFTLAPQ